jgi:biuret amidohydrolase
MDFESLTLLKGENTINLDAHAMALVVIDMQRYFVRPGYAFGQVWDRLSPDDAGKYFAAIGATVIPNIKTLLSRCRELAIPVYFTAFGSIREDGQDLPRWARQQNVLSQRLVGAAIYPSRSDPSWQIDDDLAPRPEEYVVAKTTSGPLSSTNLDVTLRGRGIETLLVVGVATNVCVTQAAREFADRGFHVIVPYDACTTIGEQRHDAALETFAFIFGRVCSTTSVLSALSLPSAAEAVAADARHF